MNNLVEVDEDELPELDADGPRTNGDHLSGKAVTNSPIVSEKDSPQNLQPSCLNGLKRETSI